MFRTYDGQIYCDRCATPAAPPLRPMFVCGGCGERYPLFEEAVTDSEGRTCKPTGSTWKEERRQDRYVTTFRPANATRRPFDAAAICVLAVILSLQVAFVCMFVGHVAPGLLAVVPQIFMVRALRRAASRYVFTIERDRLRLVIRPLGVMHRAWSLDGVVRFFPDATLDGEGKVYHYVRGEGEGGQYIGFGRGSGEPLMMPDRQHAAFFAQRWSEALERLRALRIDAGPYRGGARCAAHEDEDAVVEERASRRA